jgi:hypothetical protein
VAGTWEPIEITDRRNTTESRILLLKQIPIDYPVASREKVYQELESHSEIIAVSWAWYMLFPYGEYQLDGLRAAADRDR